MNFAAYVRRIKRDPSYAGQIQHVEEIPARAPRFAEPAAPVHPVLAERLRAQGVERLYTHQAAALDAARRGEHVQVVTSTASGKTLCYNLPVIERILAEPSARAFYLFPTKALAQDQLGKLNDLGLFPTVRFATYDGDTPREDRRFVKRGAHIVLTNPDMLHVGILPYHTTWSAFLAHLRFVVIDELHTYRGVFGAHVAQVLRRLRRVSAAYGASPQLIACSATIANPTDAIRRLTGLDAALIDDDGSPSGKRTFVFWNPPIIPDTDGRRSAHVDAAAIFRRLVSDGIRNITFAKVRKSAELVLMYARDAFERDGSPLAGRIMSYRAGYTPRERRAIERGLFDGRLIGVTATNALELGVDVGGLDATVITGYPGAIASLWQQAGRAGRGASEALTILIAQDNPLDQFLMRHPQFVLERPVEQAVVDPDNRRVLEAHLRCAAFELPLTEADAALFGARTQGLIADMEEDCVLTRRGERWYYAPEDYPAGAVSIRAASSDRFAIRAGGLDGEVLGEIERERAYFAVHPGAIYLHQGESYLVEALDEATRVAVVRAADEDYYTQTLETTTITVLKERQRRSLSAAVAAFGDVVVTTRVVGYRKKDLRTHAVIETTALDLPELAFETEATWLALPERVMAEAGEAGIEFAGAIHAVEHAITAMAPLLTACDRSDLGGVTSPTHPDTGRATIFVYDDRPGGLGLAEAIFERLPELLAACAALVDECPCGDGCPACLHSPRCPGNNAPLDKAGAIWLLRGLSAANHILPAGRSLQHA